jgi:SOS-response transcriptional repressor LexA
MTRSLTHRQAQLLSFLLAYSARHGAMPTLKEMAAALGIAAEHSPSDMLRRLHAKGYLRVSGKARGVTLDPSAWGPALPDADATPPKKERPLCRHCWKKPANRPRQMCWDCYYAPGVRDLYPVTSRYATRAARGLPTTKEYDGPSPPPPEPTAAVNGTVRKMAVLEERALLGIALRHSGDADADPETARSCVGRQAGCRRRA